MIELIAIPADVGEPMTILELADPNDIGRLQGAVGGWIEMVRAGDEAWMIINEEGKIFGLPVNRRATGLWYELLGFRADDVLVGDVLVCGSPDTEGDTTSAPASIRTLLGV